jgi:outer membrane lipoprotein SlyB
MKIPFNSSQIVASVLGAGVLLAGAYAVGRASAPAPAPLPLATPSGVTDPVVVPAPGQAPAQGLQAAALDGSGRVVANPAQGVTPAGAGTAVAQAPMSEPARPHAEAAPALCGECVRVVDVHQETRKGKSSGVGAVGGAVLGGLLGNQVGGGNGRKLATIGGAVAGGYAGNEIEKNRNARHVWVLKLSRADGSTQRLEQGQDPGVVPGDVVIVRNGHVERQAR